MSIGQKIKWAREERGWTVVQLAEASGVTFLRIEGIESCTDYLYYSELGSIADALNRDVGWFMDDEEPDDEICLHCKESNILGRKE